MNYGSFYHKKAKGPIYTKPEPSDATCSFVTRHIGLSDHTIWPPFLLLKVRSKSDNREE